MKRRPVHSYHPDHALIGAFLLLSLFCEAAAPAERASDRPTGAAVVYDREHDRSTVSARLGPLLFQYEFAGAVQVVPIDRLTVLLDEPYRSGRTSVTFLVNGGRRVEIVSPPWNSVTAEWLQNLLRAGTLDVLVMTDRGGKRFSIDPQAVRAVDDLLDRTLYFSAEGAAWRGLRAAVQRETRRLRVRLNHARREIWLLNRKPGWAFFAPPDSPVVVYVIDVSGSMIEELTAVKRAVTRAVDALPARTHFNVVTVGGGEGKWFRPRPLPATGANRKDFGRWLEEVGTSGSAEGLGPAAGSAVRQGAGTIVFLSDCDLPDVTIAEVSDALREADVELNVLAVAASADDLFAIKRNVDAIRQLAESHGGTFKVQFLTDEE